jgi:2-haloalkanoic acid dehalogenase type II
LAGKRFSHYTFDCFGTLIDWRKGIEEQLGGSLARHGISWSADVFRAYIELEAREEMLRYQSYRNVLRNTALRLSEQFGTEMSREEAESFAASVPLWPPFGDSVETMRELGKMGITRVILSNVDRDLLMKTISRSGLEVDGFITAEDVMSYKPDSGHWVRFLKEYPVGKEFVLHVAGSIHHDIIPASRLGFTTVWVNRYAETDRQGAIPSYVLNDLKGLLELSV